MVIAVAGPYSSADPIQRQKNLENLNVAAAKLVELGHTPVIGVNAALPVIERCHFKTEADRYSTIMDISMAAIASCEAILYLAESPGAKRERDFLVERGATLYTSLEQIPQA